MLRDEPASTLSRRMALRGLGLSVLFLSGPSAAASEAKPLVLTAGHASLTLGGPDQPPTATWAYDGRTPGPLIRIGQGEEVYVRLVNRLDQPTALHWQGVRLANAMDGVSGLTQAPVAPGGVFDYRFKAPDAGTYLYRPPRAGDTGGLYGVLIVDEAVPPPVDRDIVLVLDRWQREAPSPLLTVNSGRNEDIPLRRNERLRLRFVNAATGSIAALAFAGIAPVIVALDGQPVNTPFPPDGQRLDLPPGGRADIIVDGTLAEGDLAGIALLDGSTIVEIARFLPVPGKPLRADPQPRPGPLPANALPAGIDLAKARRFDLAIGRPAVNQSNGRSNGPPLFSVKRGAPVTLALINGTDSVQSVHIHGHAVRVLHPLDDGWEPCWLDTILVPGGQTVRIAFVADNPGKWLVETRAIEHPDAGEMTWFEVS